MKRKHLFIASVSASLIAAPTILIACNSNNNESDEQTTLNDVAHAMSKSYDLDTNSGISSVADFKSQLANIGNLVFINKLSGFSTLLGSNTIVSASSIGDEIDTEKLTYVLKITDANKKVQATVNLTIKGFSMSLENEFASIKAAWEEVIKTPANLTNAKYNQTKASDFKLTTADFKSNFPKLHDVFSANSYTVNNFKLANANDVNGTVALEVNATNKSNHIILLTTTLTGFKKGTTATIITPPSDKMDEVDFSALKKDWDEVIKSSFNRTSSAYSNQLPSQLSNFTKANIVSSYNPLNQVFLKHNATLDGITLSNRNDNAGTVDVTLKVTLNKSSTTLNVTLIGFKKTKTDQEALNEIVTSFNDAKNTTTNLTYSGQETILPSKLTPTKLHSNFGTWFSVLAKTIASAKSYSISLTSQNDSDGSLIATINLVYQPSNNSKEHKASVNIKLTGFANNASVVNKVFTELNNKKFAVQGQTNVTPTKTTISGVDDLKNKVSELKATLNNYSSDYGVTFNAPAFAVDTQEGTITASFNINKTGATSKKVSVVITGYKAINDKTILDTFVKSLKSNLTLKQDDRSKIPSELSLNTVVLINQHTDANIVTRDGITITVQPNQNNDKTGIKKVTLNLKLNKETQTHTLTIENFDTTVKRDEIKQKFVNDKGKEFSAFTLVPANDSLKAKTSTEAIKNWTSFETIKKDVKLANNGDWPKGFEYKLDNVADKIKANNTSGSVQIKLIISKDGFESKFTMTVSGYSFISKDLFEKIEKLSIKEDKKKDLSSFKETWNLVSNKNQITTDKLMKALEIQSGVSGLANEFIGFETVKEDFNAELVSGDNQGIKNTLKITFTLKHTASGKTNKFVVQFKGYLVVEIYAWQIKVHQSPVRDDVIDFDRNKFNKGTASVEIAQYPTKSEITSYLKWLSKSILVSDQVWLDFGNLMKDKLAYMNYPEASRGSLYFGSNSRGIILYPASRDEINSLWAEISKHPGKAWENSDIGSFNSDQKARANLIIKNAIIGWNAKDQYYRYPNETNNRHDNTGRATESQVSDLWNKDNNVRFSAYVMLELYRVRENFK